MQQGVNQMITFANMNTDFPASSQEAPVQDGVQIRGFSFVATALPMIGRITGAAQAVGVALAFAEDESDACGEDRFALLLVDAQDGVLARLGPFTEEDVVAIWRDCAARTGLPRMILREDGQFAEVSRQIGRLSLGRSRQRRRVGLLNGRRPRFLVRRKTARLPARPQIHRGENEIIARS